MTTQSKFTPGPWQIHGDPQTEICDIGTQPLANTGIPCRSFIEQQANARLIAAAPDMLDGLELSIERLELNNVEGSEQWIIDKLTAILKSATGFD